MKTMINSIYLKNIRNIYGEATQELTGMDIFVGRNGMGKSTRLDAVPLTILGYLPQAGKSLETVFRDANSDEMTIGLNTEDFRTVRKFRRKDNGLTQEITINELPVAKEIGAEAIRKTFGDDIFVFDLNDFLNLSDDKRKDFLFNLSLGGNTENPKLIVLEQVFRNYFTAGEVDGLLKFKYNLKSFAEFNPEQLTEAIETLCAGTGEEQRQSLRNIVDFIMSKDVAGTREYLYNILSQANDDLKLQRKIIRDSESVNREIRRMQQDIELNDTLPALLDEQVRLNQAITDLAVKTAENEKNKKVIANHQDKIIRIARNLAKLAEFDHPKTNAEIAKLEGYMQTAEAYKQKLDELKPLRTVAFRAISDLNYALKEIQQIGTKKFCVLSDQVPCDTDMKLARENINLLIKEKEIDLEKLDSQIVEIQSHLAEQFGATWDPVERLVKNFEKDIADIKQSIRNNEDSVKFYDNERLELEKTDLSAFNVVDDQTYIVEMAGLKNRNGVVADLIEKQQAWKQKLLTMQAANISATKAESEITIDKLVIDSTRQVINRELEKQTIPLAEVVNKLLAQINPEYHFSIYLDDKDKLTFGWPKENGFIPFEGLSSGQKVLFSVALITALIIRKNPPMKILCLKAAEVDLDGFELLLSGLKMLKENLDNILVEYPHLCKAAYDGWKVWDLNKG